jgi:Fe-S cluster biogenesis protein NfuA
MVKGTKTTPGDLGQHDCRRLGKADGSKRKEEEGGGDKEMRENVEKALEMIRPALRADGGDIELVDVIDGVVKVRLTGACGGCPMSQMTLKMGVERVLKQQVPEVKSVETV